MLRFFIIIRTVWRFGLDDIVLSAFNRPAVRRWRALTAWRHKRSGAERLRLALEHLGPIFIKFGQLLSTRRDILHADYADELAKLQDRVPPEPPAVIDAALQAAYGKPLTEIFAEFEATPVGSASVAQVHRARLRDGGDAVAVKILRPGVEKQIARDIRLLRAFAAFANLLLKDSRRLKPREIIEEFSRSLQAETRLMREAANCAKIGRNHETSEMLKVPAVRWQWCTETVMVMDFLEGIPVSRVDELGGHIDKKALATAGIEIFFTQVFRDNFFHADMHPGNVHVNASGQFVLFDYGIVGQLSEFDKEYLLRNFLAFFNRDYRRVAEMHIESGWVPLHTDVQAFEAEIRTVCEPIFAQPLKNISFGRFLLNMFRTARKFNLEVQPQLILLQKTLLNIEGMGRELSPDINMWDTAKPILERWAAAQNHPTRALALLKRQLPDWFALLADAPLVARLLLQRQKNAEPVAETEHWRRRARFWQIVAATAVVLSLLGGGLFFWLAR